MQIILYLDDGIATANTLEKAETDSARVRKDLIEFGFLIAEEKSDWLPKSTVTWLGHEFDFKNSYISITDTRTNKILKKLNNILVFASENNGYVTARYLLRS